MISIYLTDCGRLLEQDQICPGAWIHMSAPNEKEIGRVCAQLHVDPDLVRASLDEEERSRIEQEDGITLILVIAARVTMPRYATHGGVGAGGIIALVCAIVCLVIGVAVGVLFPEGLIQQSNDKAPVEDTAQMEQGIEQAAGACKEGWQGLDTGGLPGITTVQMCTDPRVAFVSFESESSAAISRAPIESKISELLSQYADNEQTKGDWRLLNGKRWMVFGEASKMTALQQQWGGELETITAAADTADSGNA